MKYVASETCRAKLYCIGCICIYVRMRRREIKEVFTAVSHAHLKIIDHPDAHRSEFYKVKK